MAVTLKDNVIISTANADAITGPVSVVGILYVAGTGGPSASLTIGGTTVWQTVATVDVFQQIELHSAGDLAVVMAGTGTKLIIYTDVE